MTTTLFWNINRNPVFDLVAHLCAEHNPDIVALAECKLERSALLHAVNTRCPIPFDLGIAAATGLHAVMDRSIASKRRRTVDDEQIAYFYNPMWSLMGDFCLLDLLERTTMIHRVPFATSGIHMTKYFCVPISYRSYLLKASVYLPRSLVIPYSTLQAGLARINLIICRYSVH